MSYGAGARENTAGGSTEPFRQEWTELTADLLGSDRVAVELEDTTGASFFFSFEF